MAKIRIALLDDQIEEVEATIYGSLACHDNTITHVSTGLRIMDGDEALTQYLNKSVRWNWLNQFGLNEVPPKGRGLTMLRKSLCEKLGCYTGTEVSEKSRSSRRSRPATFGSESTTTPTRGGRSISARSSKGG